MTNFTFKKIARTGRFRSFDQKETDVKLKGLQVGSITESREEVDTWRISLAVKKERTEKNPAPFKWVRFKKVFKDEKAARDFLTQHSDRLQEKLDLHSFED